MLIITSTSVLPPPSPSALVIVGAFTSVCACVVFLALKRRGVLRVDHITELAGIDNMEHGGPAYPEFNLTGDCGCL